MSIDTKIQHTTPAGGNIFDDLGFDKLEANKLKLKSQLMVRLTQWIAEHNYTQEQASKILEINRPRVSDLTRGKIDKFTIDALVDMVEKTGHHVILEVA